jgi:hypothetical protein
VQYRAELERLSKRTGRSIPTLVREARAASKLPWLGRDVKTRSVLEKAYRRYNRKFFRNRLPNPPAVVLRWAPLKGISGRWLPGEIPTIEINKRFKSWEIFWTQILVHEMIHISLPNGAAHGLRFHDEMFRIMADGLMDALGTPWPLLRYCSLLETT